ncbi:phosphatase PAP2 family protein [Saccharopolyspora sp. WRP15-2]|uniref:Phosphatase PAP2 family protein n=1 Tax=Saccharopolyspora oryzae TaxID=2997343 RepID=A0ABT4UR37_9PSEU|nr:phosphatase PAP2 family protein [Saccharopolyspora oryzae]MDA3624185.1 phosphatase PAP2 family protein [Saccharopolyspora oryzae]
MKADRVPRADVGEEERAGPSPNAAGPVVRRSVLIAPPLRWPLALVAGACLLVLVALSVRYAGHTEPSALDLAARRWLRAHIADQHIGALHEIGELGNHRPALAATALICGIGYLSGRWKQLLLPAIGPPAAIVLSQLLKPLIGRTINDYWALPSGHTTALVALLTTAGVIWFHRTSITVTVLSGLAFFGLGCVTTAMATSMTSLNLHYATDIVAGGCLGFAVVVAVALALDHLDGNRWRVPLRFARRTTSRNSTPTCTAKHRGATK